MFQQIPIPLYSRGRPLKNLLSNWQKTYNAGLLGKINPVTGEFTPSEIYNEGIYKELYEHAIHHWYFADINYDTDQEFVWRFNTAYEDNIEKFVSIINELKSSSLFTSKFSATKENSKSGEDTKSVTRNNTDTEASSGSDIQAKGVTTTSEVETSNEGSKLSRSTPNENLSVSGGSTTTVTDSGQDTTTYGKVVTKSFEHEESEITAYGSGETFTEDNQTNETVSPDKLQAMLKMPSVFEEFAYCFENLFLEVL